VLLLGDLCDGNNRKEFGRNLTSVELEAQVEICKRLLLPHCKGKRVYGVSGSPYHESLDVSLDKLVIEGVGGQFLGLLAHLDITGTGQVIQLRHGDSSSLIYRETDMARESMFLDMVQGIELPFTIDLVVRGHWHWFAYNVNRRRAFLQLPGWKLWFPWRSGKYGKYIPDLGGCVLDVSRAGITCQEHLYPYIPCYDALQKA